MSKAQHTPGPWAVEEGGMIRATDPAVGIALKRGIAQPQIALVVGLHEQRPEGEQRANAALVAAAPDLLAANNHAIEFVRYALEFFDWMRFPNLQESAELLEHQLSEAIAKATGN